MKLLILLLFPIISFTQTIIPFEYKDSKEKPLVFTHGDQLNIETDTIYLYNSQRHRLFSKVVRLFLDGQFSDDYLLNLYEKSEENTSYLFSRIQNNTLTIQEQLSEAEKELIEIRKQRNEQLESDKILVAQMRAEATESLRIAKAMNRGVKKGKFKNFMIGLGVGALATGTIFFLK